MSDPVPPRDLLRAWRCCSRSRSSPAGAAAAAAAAARPATATATAMRRRRRCAGGEQARSGGASPAARRWKGGWTDGGRPAPRGAMARTRRGG
eukprot:scaffold2268_cov349-Prasinococcus_capsulatus_cf.AAC.5